MAEAADDPHDAHSDRCFVCLHSLVDPHALLCNHFCCKSCIAMLEPNLCDDVSGVTCVLCRKFTPDNALRPITFVKATSHAEVERVCDTCHNEVPQWRCHDCKEDYCDVCRKYHDRFGLFRNHNTVALSAEAVTPLCDKNVFCEVHPEEMIKLHCKDCRKLICLLCNGTAHKNHRAETADDAIADVKPRVMRMRNKCEDRLASCFHELQSAQNDREAVKQQYQDIQECIDEKFDEAIARVRRDCAELVRELNESRVNQMRVLNGRVAAVNESIEKRKIVIEACDELFSKRQGVYLLHGLQSEILPALHELGTETQKPKIDPVANMKFLETTPDGNTIGCFAPVHDDNSAILNVKINDFIAINSFTLLRNVQLEFEAIRLIKIENELWFVEDGTNNVHIYSADEEVTCKRVMSSENTGEIRSLALYNNRVLVAAQRGTFYSNLEGLACKILTTGDFCDISVYDNIVASLENSCGKIVVLKFENRRKYDVSVVNEIPIYGYVPHTWNSILLTEEHIFICIGPSNAVLKFKKSGQLCNSVVPPESIGDFQFPVINCMDLNRNILIADRNNNRILTTSHKPEWSVFEFPDMNEYPSSFVIVKNMIYVVCWFKNMQVYKYSAIEKNFTRM